ncbi:MAG: hypothetical protein L6V88_11900 [Anaerotruncus sp.]|nr:MAG: hypothetical protein L6V88_11900 [Anaerotruncus sp.]
MLLTDNMFTCFHRVYDKKMKERHIFLCVEKNVFINKPQTNCCLFIIDVNDLTIEKQLHISFEHGAYPRALLNSQYVLLNNMEVVNISNDERFLLDVNNCFEEKENGYFFKKPNSSIAV